MLHHRLLRILRRCWCPSTVGDRGLHSLLRQDRWPLVGRWRHSAALTLCRSRAPLSSSFWFDVSIAKSRANRVATPNVVPAGKHNCITCRTRGAQSSDDGRRKVRPKTAIYDWNRHARPGSPGMHGRRAAASSHLAGPGGGFVRRRRAFFTDLTAIEGGSDYASYRTVFDG